MSGAYWRNSATPNSRAWWRRGHSLRRRRGIQRCPVPHSRARAARERRRANWARSDASSPEAWRESCHAYRNHLWNEVIGQFFEASVKSNPRSRLIYDEPKYQGYELVLDVWPDVFGYGILLLPRGIPDGE